MILFDILCQSIWHNMSKRIIDTSKPSMMNFIWMTTLLKTEVTDVFLSLCWWGFVAVGGRKHKPDLATAADQHYYGRELVDLEMGPGEQEQDQQDHGQEDGIEMVAGDRDDFVAIKTRTLYDTVHHHLHRYRCPICLDSPAAGNVSMAVSLCIRVSCGDCTMYTVENAMEVTGKLNFPMCVCPFEA
jgi:hypothetical protein